MKQTQNLKTYIALNSAVIIWGFSFVATKIALESFSTFTLVFARFSIAGVIFLFLMLRNGFPSFAGKDRGKIMLIALFEPGLYFICETIGLQYTTAPKASLIIAMIPVMVLVFSIFFLNESVSISGFLGIGLSLVGIMVLIAGAPELNWDMGGQLLGDLLIFGAAISAALYMVFARDLGKRYSAFDITAMQIIYGAILYAPLFLWELPGVHWAEISSRSLAAFIFLTMFATIVAFLCYNYALTQMTAPRAAVFINGIPIVTALGAWMLLGEKLTAIQACGGVVVLFAVYLVNRPSAKPVLS